MPELPPMRLRELVDKYLALAGEFGRAVALEQFGLSREATEQLFGFLDEDYHISRYFHWRNDSGESYDVNGFPQTHVAIDAEIAAIL